jgi:PST family polysaccharide transporter
MLTAITVTSATALIFYGLSFCRNVVLARLLNPDVFGLFGLVTTVNAGVLAATSLNLSSLVVQRAVRDDQELECLANTVWTMDLAKAALQSLILLLLAYPSVAFFKDDRVLPVLLAVSCTPLFNGFLNIGLALARRNMDFRPAAMTDLAGLVVSSAVAIVSAWLGLDVWSLVIAQLVGAVAASVVSYYAHSFRPRLQIDRGLGRAALAFGGHLLAVSALTYVTTQFDNLIVGRAWGAATLGAYLVAYRLSSLPTELATQMTGDVLFASYVRASRSDPARLVQVFADTFAASAIGLAFLLAPLWLAGSEIVRLLYGSKWHAAGALVATLAMLGLLRGLARSIAPLLIALGRVGGESASKTAEATLFIPAVLILVPRLGPVGAAYAGIASYGLGFAVRFVIALRILPFGAPALWSMVARAVVALTTAGGLAQLAGPEQSPWLAAAIFEVVLIVLAGLLYPATCRRILEKLHPTMQS